MPIGGDVIVKDGVAVSTRGDTVLCVYQEPARLHRTRWLFDVVDSFAAQRPTGIMALLVVLNTADLPDRLTRVENSQRLRKLGPTLRRLVTVPIGDAFRLNVVRTVMRAISMVQGTSRVHLVASTLDEGLRRLLEGAESATPGRKQLEIDLRTIFDKLGVDVRPMLDRSA